jgi:hypothetical protein
MPTTGITNITGKRLSMTTITKSATEANYGEDAAIERAEPDFDRRTLVFVVGPRAVRPEGRSSSGIRNAIDRRSSNRSAD